MADLEAARTELVSVMVDGPAGLVTIETWQTFTTAVLSVEEAVVLRDLLMLLLPDERARTRALFGRTM